MDRKAELAVIEGHLADDRDTWLPVLSIQDSMQRRDSVVEFVGKCMKPDTDYGVIPGTGGKPTLLKPGAEKLCTLFGLSKHFTLPTVVEDWTGRDHNGEPFFYYVYRCSLYRGDLLVAEADGSCNSWEKKYRYRQTQRVCPKCGQPAIITGKAEYGGGFLCFGKKGGCGAKFKENDPIILDQKVGQEPNPDVADQVNTIQKMAQKRALVAACLLAVNASEFFTQDIEDMGTPAPTPAEEMDGMAQRVDREPSAPSPVPTGGKANGSKPPLSTEEAACRKGMVWLKAWMEECKLPETKEMRCAFATEALTRPVDDMKALSSQDWATIKTHCQSMTDEDILGWQAVAQNVVGAKA